ncbi:voltage-gated potassium channel [Mollisia scopiformis]|uniref:Voltage-gated potassium channel n=1 Tax=Mollisia scopiformis TaxID=149040 RepID=A0A194XFH8_MOLSC|nr:voltage-gated potassium channel [Mollisia scopiformis]KUJ18901.1 voltage-gated potassium channel [Mollisia scopiformis]
MESPKPTAQDEPKNQDHKVSPLAEEPKEFYQSSRVWYAATVFPLAAACFGPLASALNICALVEEWRVIIPAGDVESTEIAVGDPSWLVAINAISLAIAILANLSLLLSFAHRLPFHAAQAATIVGWYISSIMLLVIIILTPTHLQTGTLYSYGQPFVYACLSAVLYFIFATLLLITTFGAIKGYYHPDFSATLTLPQRTLMAQSTCFVAYLICGAAVFAHIEGWIFVDGVYWATVTLLTIGYGDVVPKTHLGRSLIIPYATSGIIMIGLVAGSIGSLVIDQAQKKMVSRLTVKQRELLQADFDQEARNDQNHESEHIRERAEFNLMRRIQSRARSRQLWLLTGIAAVALVLLWFIGAVVFWKTESTPTSFQSAPWSYFDAVYFVFISTVTIGYGDFYVESNIGRPIFVFWGLLAVPTMTILIASMGATVLVIIKGIIAQIDRFVVLEHEGGGRERHSFARKAFHMGKLHLKHRRGSNKDGHHGGMERHGEHGFRDRKTGKIMNIHDETGHIPHPDHDHDEAVTMRQYLIAKEIRSLLEDVSASPPRTYTFEEWARFLKLLEIKHREKDTSAPSQNSNGGNGEIDENGWSWLQDDGPLFGTQTETEWLLQKLSKQLEDSLTPTI